MLHNPNWGFIMCLALSMCVPCSLTNRTDITISIILQSDSTVLTLKRIYDIKQIEFVWSIISTAPSRSSRTTYDAWGQVEPLMTIFYHDWTHVHPHLTLLGNYVLKQVYTIMWNSILQFCWSPAPSFRSRQLLVFLRSSNIYIFLLLSNDGPSIFPWMAYNSSPFLLMLWANHSPSSLLLHPR